MKISIIIPVYNTEKYLDKCLYSIYNQTYKNYEVIIVNDGSTDNSLDIINKYKDNKTILINQKNMGLSSARNRGVLKATGDYIWFIDSDDYIELNSLEIISNNLNDNPDVLRIQLSTIKNNVPKQYPEDKFINLSGEEAIIKIINYNFVEPSPLYIYNRNFYNKNKFSFKEGFYHEDYGLTLYILAKAKNVNCIYNCLYNYYLRENSITSSNNYLKKYLDSKIQYYEAKKSIKKMHLNHEKEIISYMANGLLWALIKISGNEYKKELKKLKQENFFEDILDNTLSRKIKKIILKINPKFIYRV